MNYIKRFLLRLSDPRYGAAMRAVERPGACLGDLAGAPETAAAFFRPLKTGLARAAGATRRRPGPTALLAAAEDFALRLEKVFADMALHQTRPDAAAREALLTLQRACALFSGGDGKAAAEAAAFCAQGRKSLRLARAAADSDPANFPRNLKFSSMYSGLDAVFDALERCAQALAEAGSGPRTKNS